MTRLLERVVDGRPNLYMAASVLQQLWEAEERMRACAGSPLEADLLWTIYLMATFEYPLGGALLYGLHRKAGKESIEPCGILLGAHPTAPHLVIRPQGEIGPYRADGLLIGGLNEGCDESVLVAVECDGHEFHERTKQQAAHDKRRDRFFAERDIMVLRFTGSEIHRDVEACAREALRVLVTTLVRRNRALVGAP